MKVTSNILSRLKDDQKHLLRDAFTLWYGSRTDLSRELETGRIETLSRLYQNDNAFVATRRTNEARLVKQLFVKTRRKNLLYGGRKAIGYTRYVQDFKAFVRMHYADVLEDVPNDLFHSSNVDHAVPLSWLLKPAGSDAKNLPVDHSSNTPAAYRDAVERGEVVEYVAIALCDEVSNKAWGSHLEKMFFRTQIRHSSLGVANFFTLCKLANLAPYAPSRSNETLDGFSDRILTALVQIGILTETDKAIAERSIFRTTSDSFGTAPESGINAVQELLLRFTGKPIPAPPPISGRELGYWEHPEMKSALHSVDCWLEGEGGKVDKAAIARELVKISRDSGRIDLKIAAFAMLAVGVKPNADDIAWLVRDGSLGYPMNPSSSLEE
ncbi:hypothetical protein [Azospirillum lipoferum]|nr:hypothetical protein [Azospirillum lipoferum]